MLTRKMLSAMEIEPEKITQIIEGHSESINALQEELDQAKADIDKYKAEADKVAGLEKELKDAKKEAETAKNSSAEYDKLKQQFEDYKAEQAKKQENAIKRDKFKELLKDIGISDTGVKKILKWQGVEGVELDEDGEKITNAKELRKAVKEDWSEFLVDTHIEGNDPATPPANNPQDGKTKEEILAIKDYKEMQAEIAKHHDLFGF